MLGSLEPPWRTMILGGGQSLVGLAAADDWAGGAGKFAVAVCDEA
jgi:hypothetical protein